MPNSNPKSEPQIAVDPVATTPLMKQFWNLKEKTGDALLLFRMGDFYELFGDDAVEAAKILDITLTTRDKGRPNPTPMAGVPFHSIESYLQKLLDHGKKVAIAEQIIESGADKNQKGIVNREIARVFTPAVQFNSNSESNSFLAVVIKNKTNQFACGLLEPSTGELRTSTFGSVEDVISSIAPFGVRHILQFSNLISKSDAPDLLLELLPPNYLSDSQVELELQRHYENPAILKHFFTELEAKSAAILARYTALSQNKEKLGYIKLPKSLKVSNQLSFGSSTADHLDLFPKSSGDSNLFRFLAKTRSAMGARRLRDWIQAPLVDPEAIAARQNQIRAVAKSSQIRTKISSLLSNVYDLERILSRVYHELCSPRDLEALQKTLNSVPGTIAELEKLSDPSLEFLTKSLRESYEICRPLDDELESAIIEAPPLHCRDGGIFKKGYHSELDQLIELDEQGHRFISELEAKERLETKIPSLKVKYNRVFGYFIEVTKTHLDKVPNTYQRKQSTVNSERFFTVELKRFEDEVLSAGEKRKALEQELFSILIEKIKNEHLTVQKIAEALSNLDVLFALSFWTDQPGWTFPKIDTSLDLNIHEGRHPIVAESRRGEFVPNDLVFDQENQRTLIITGPNMGGKSTVMRQIALIVILGQMGAPVPATRASWGVFSSVFTRIGAHDAIAKGQSTFMVEMMELAEILNRADERSLIVLDEVGRGTSTFDGMSVAWATLEWISLKIKARTLFATHYHELTHLENKFPTIHNTHMAVAESKDRKIRFLYELRNGASSESFGIQVAELAGLPSAVIQRARVVLRNAESDDKSSQESRLFSAPDDSQLSLFETPEPAPSREGILKTVIDAINIDETTPLQALGILSDLKTKSII